MEHVSRIHSIYIVLACDVLGSKRLLLLACYAVPCLLLLGYDFPFFTNSVPLPGSVTNDDM